MKNKEQHKKINTEARRQAALVFSETDINEQKAKLEEIFAGYEATILDLTESETAAKESNEVLSVRHEELKEAKKVLESQITSFDQEKTDLETKLEEANERAKELEGKLASIENEIKLQSRVKELEEAGVLSKGKSAEKQLDKIKVMSDESFAEYVEEQKELRSELLEEAKAMLKRNDADTASTDAPDNDAASQDNTNDTGDLEVAKMTKKELIEALRASAGLNLPSQNKSTESYSASPDYVDKVNSMWDDPETK
jgi:chromosome segregation ATPase